MQLMNDGVDEWVTAAMKDDTIVADLLLRLKMPNASTVERSLVTPAWGFRKLRSSAVDSTKKEGETMRCSPNTPFSWSEFTDGSPSTTTGDGCETSSQLNYSSPTARSKVAVTNEATTSSDQKSKNVKELTTLHSTFDDQISRNEMFKRLKVEHIPQHTTRTYAAFYDEKHQFSSSSCTQQALVQWPNHAASYNALQTDLLKTEKQCSLPKRNFILPDLNMMPPENDSW